MKKGHSEIQDSSYQPTPPQGSDSFKDPNNLKKANSSVDPE